MPQKYHFLDPKKPYTFLCGKKSINYPYNEIMMQDETGRYEPCFRCLEKIDETYDAGFHCHCLKLLPAVTDSALEVRSITLIYTHEKNMNNYTFIDLFSGIGGFREASKKFSLKCLGFSEINKEAIEVYKLNHNQNEIEFGDITKIDEKNLPNFDILFGGFPCQSFSLAGKRLGFEDVRGTLFFDILRILKEKRPKMFILENVSNLENHDRGNTLGVILRLLSQTINNTIMFDIEDESLKYHVFYKVLNANNYGVPQRRNRIYIIGFDQQVNFKFPKTTNPNTTFKDVMELKDDYTPYYLKDTPSRRKMIESETILLPKSIVNTLTCKQDRWNAPGFVPINSWYRFLTEREQARLQGFPDSFKIPNYPLPTIDRLFGNSVCVKVIEELIKSMVGAYERIESA